MDITLLYCSTVAMNENWFQWKVCYSQVILSTLLSKYSFYVNIPSWAQYPDICDMDYSAKNSRKLWSREGKFGEIWSLNWISATGQEFSFHIPVFRLTFVQKLIGWLFAELCLKLTVDGNESCQAPSSTEGGLQGEGKGI